MRGHIEEWLFRDGGCVMLAFVEFGVEAGWFSRSSRFIQPVRQVPGERLEARLAILSL